MRILIVLGVLSTSLLVLAVAGAVPGHGEGNGTSMVAGSFTGNGLPAAGTFGGNG